MLRLDERSTEINVVYYCTKRHDGVGVGVWTGEPDGGGARGSGELLPGINRV